MDENQQICPTCRGVVENEVCTICGQEVVKNEYSEGEDEFICPVCHQPESSCLCGE